MAENEKNPEDYKINVRVINIFRHFTNVNLLLKQKDFADMIGVLPARISHIFKYQNKPDSNFLEKLAIAFPTLNCRWLLTGEGLIENKTVAELEKIISDQSKEITELKQKLNDVL